MMANVVVSYRGIHGITKFPSEAMDHNKKTRAQEHNRDEKIDV